MSDPARRAVAAVVRAERARAGLTLEELSQAAMAYATTHQISTRGLSVNALSRVQSEKTDATSSTLYAIAGALGLEPAVLVPKLESQGGERKGKG